MSELSKFTLESLKQEDASSFLGVAKETFEYHETLNDTFDEYLSSSEDATVRYINAKANFTRLATRLQKKIHELEEFLESCSDAVPNS